MIGTVLRLRWAACSLRLRCDLLIHVCTIASQWRKNFRNDCQFLQYSIFVQLFFTAIQARSLGLLTAKNLIKSFIKAFEKLKSSK